MNTPGTCTLGIVGAVQIFLRYDQRCISVFIELVTRFKNQRRTSLAGIMISPIYAQHQLRAVCPKIIASLMVTV